VRILTASNVPLESHLGSGYVISGYIDGLRAAGHEVTSLAPCDYEILPGLRMAKRLRVLFGYTRTVLRAVQTAHYDLVELWGAESWWTARRLARRARRPLVIGRSNGIETLCNETLLRAGAMPHASQSGQMFDRWQRTEDAFRFVDALTTVSLQDAEFATARRYQPATRILALENPLPAEWLDQPCALERPRMLGFFGSWLPRKGAALLPPVLTQVLRAHPEWRAHLVGVGDVNPATLFPPDVALRIEVLPRVTNRAQVRQLYHQTAIVVMPSVFESFGLVAAESMACGCALVASPTGFAATLRPEDGPLVVNEHRPGAWVNAMSSLMADEPQRRQRAQAGCKRVQSLRWEPAIARLLEFYERMRQIAART
jgi:glycosyltransferase involved in cell wall biosynthesis